ncbi:hypothetical protein ACWGOE_01825 [Leucobacter chromiiresistens]|uniref:Uncharacterized protein n=1 Tax=Leucobacter chromiiresistens TaxID=1079994 RepID=A0A1H1BF44_9MICO|nr:hypothetical protein [Leucobacter chromiiresistens]SDQ50006.1 hypothetical protein SAMN04488565_2753 [Leucobacter chromiiresistens]
MADLEEFQVDESVVAPSGARGVICDVRRMTNGATSYGVLDTTGSIRYYTADSIKRVL